MKTYWDLSEQERANLTRETILEVFAKIEMMTNGAGLLFQPQELEKEFEIKTENETIFALKQGDYNPLKIAFKNIEDAKACLDLQPLIIQSSWINGSSMDYFCESNDVQIVAVQIPREAFLEIHKSEISRLNGIKSRNNEIKRENEKNVAKQTTALEALWNDYEACCSKRRQCKKVQDTFYEYLELTHQDKAIAFEFLKKTFSEEEIKESEEWFGLKFLE